MDSNYLPRSDYDALSAASHELVKRVGGQDRALDITGYKVKTQIARCTTINGEDRRFFPIKAIAEMESDVAAMGGIPPVTRALADLAGFDLVRREEVKGEQCALSSLGLLMRSFADASSAVTDSYADGELDKDEQAECIDHLQEHVDRAQKMLAILRGEKISG